MNGNVDVPPEMIITRLAQRIADLEVQLIAMQCALDITRAKLNAAESREVASET